MRGFTLIELLVVISVTSVLTAMVIPTVGLIRKRATTAACATNLHQMGLAFCAYAQDWDGCYPAERRAKGVTTAAGSDAWHDRLPDYLEAGERGGKALQCAGHRPPPATVQGFDDAFGKSFKMNDFLDGPGKRSRYFNPMTVRDASDLLLLVDAVDEVTGAGQRGYTRWSSVTDRRHRGRVNALAVDGGTLLQRSLGPWADAYRWQSDSW